ncbi:MAG: sporulation protein YqfD, partial [Clostridia bacterium]|nr:sporulation protein YqfD [Clostridia bacterium]
QHITVGDPEEKKKEPANLVAERDAVVTQTDVLHGELAVSGGKTVKKGDLLVSGWVRSTAGDSKVCAEGKVYGLVEDCLTVKVPKKTVVRTADREELQSLSLQFFGKEIFFFVNSGNSSTEYGTIERKEKVWLGEDKVLPVSVTAVYRAYYRETEQASHLPRSKRNLPVY